MGFDRDLKAAGVEEDREASADDIKNNVNSEIVTRWEKFEHDFNGLDHADTKLLSDNSFLQTLELDKIPRLILNSWFIL